MRLTIMLLPLALVLLPAMAGRAVAQPTLRPTDAAPGCLVDGQVPADLRAAVETEGLGFVRAILAGDTAAAYDSFTAETKTHLPLDRFTEMAAQAQQSFRGITGLHVAHVYMPSEVGPGAERRIACGSAVDGVRVTARAGVRQAHLLIEGDTGGNGVGFVLWLLQGQTWQVQNLYLGMSEMAGRSAADIWHLARVQAKRQHAFNAALLYAAAGTLAERGPDLELGFAPALRQEIAQVKPPHALQGQSTLSWHLGDKVYAILAVGPVGIHSKLYLMINWQSANWADDAEAEARNRLLMTDFARVFPEYVDVFAGVIVSALAEDSDRGYRSFYTSAPK
jgi:hypothetical protein